MRPELTSFINNLFDDENFVRSLYDESGKKGGLDLFLESLRHRWGLGQSIR